MEYKGARITKRRDYVLVEDPPNYTPDLEDLPNKLALVAQCCAEVGTNKVLCLGTTANFRLSTTAIFDTGIEIAKASFKMAVVFTNHDAPKEDIAFIEDVIMNRGSEFRFFDDKASALQWLGVSDEGPE